RLLWPILPILLAQLLLSTPTVGTHGRLGGFPTVSAGILAASILGLSLPALAFASARYRSAEAGELAGAAHFEGWYNPDLAHAIHRVSSQQVTIEALEAIPTFVPENDCVIAARPVIVTYFARRRAMFPPLNSVPDPLFMQALRATGCHYVFMYSA